MKDYVVSGLLPHLSSELNGQGMYSFLFQSWDSLGRNLFVYDAVANPEPIIDWPTGKSLLKLLVAIVVITASTYVMYIHARSASSKKFGVFLSVPTLAALVVLPASATYHFILLLFPIALLLRDETLTQKSRTILVVLYCAIGFIPYGIAFRVAETAGVLFAFPRLLSVFLLFIVASWVLSRKPIEAAA